MSKKAPVAPKPLIDAVSLLNQPASYINVLKESDYKAVIRFLEMYASNGATFESYRRELERLLQWSWLVADQSILSLNREDIEAYIHFCMKPLNHWIGKKRVARFIEKNGERMANPDWRPFVVSVSKRDFKHGKKARVTSYQLSQNSLRAVFAILGSFYDHLLQDDTIARNPVALIKQKNRFLQKQQTQQHVIRLSDKQWQTCIKVAKQMAGKQPALHERTLFIVTIMYLLYLRISELAASERWTPLMSHFYRDSDGEWWFKTVGKGNKVRAIAVSDAMLKALSRYRKSMGLTPMPSPSDMFPLIPKVKGKGPMKSRRQIRDLIQACFDRAVSVLQQQRLSNEAAELETATVHWLRHTGISDDVNKRGRSMLHVRDDAGHASITTTERYSDVEMRDRHQSAKNKTVTVRSSKNKPPI